MSSVIALVVIIAGLAWALWSWFSTLDDGSVIRTIEVDGYRVVWRTYGWTGAQPHFQEWNGKKWITTYKGETVAQTLFERGKREEVESADKAAVKEAIEYHESWGRPIKVPKEMR